MKGFTALIHTLDVIENGIAGTQIKISYCCPNCNGDNVVTGKLTTDLAEILYEPWVTTCVCSDCKSEVMVNYRPKKEHRARVTLDRKIEWLTKQVWYQYVYTCPCCKRQNTIILTQAAVGNDHDKTNWYDYRMCEFCDEVSLVKYRGGREVMIYKKV